MLATILFLAGQAAAAPQLPPVDLDRDQEAVVRTLAVAWRAKAPASDAPLVLARESMPAGDLPAVRLELLRHGVDAARAEQIARRLHDAAPGSMRSALFDDRLLTTIPVMDLFMLAVSKQSPEPRYRNLAVTRAISLPAFDAERRSAAVIYLQGDGIFHPGRDSSHIVFLEKGANGWNVRWESTFTLGRETANTPPMAVFTPADLRVIDAALDARFPDRSKRLLIVNETMGGARQLLSEKPVRSAAPALFDQAMKENATALFVPALRLARPVEMVPRDHFFKVMFQAGGLAGAGGMVFLSRPAYSADQQSALVLYRVVSPTSAGAETGTEAVLLGRQGNGWAVNQKWYEFSAGSPGSRPDLPYRAGGDVKPPVIRKRVDAPLPKGSSGVVIVEIVVDTRGRVTDPRILGGLPAGADPAKVLEAVRQWEFSPGTLNGVPVKVIYNIALKGSSSPQ